MSGIEGRKAILLIASGIDTFSKLTFDKCRKKLQEAGVPIYAIGLMQALRELMDAHGGMGSIQRMDFLQADNQMRTFAKETGGSLFPALPWRVPGIFKQIHQALRNQYVITYSPSNKAHDGKLPQDQSGTGGSRHHDPLKVNDEKGKPMKYTMIAKTGYKAPREVE